MAARKPKGLLAQLHEEVQVPDDIVITDDIVIPMPTRDQMIRYAEAEDGDARLAAIYGDQWEAVQEVMRSEPIHIWQALNQHVFDTVFGPGSSEVEGK